MGHSPRSEKIGVWEKSIFNVGFFKLFYFVNNQEWLNQNHTLLQRYIDYTNTSIAG